MTLRQFAARFLARAKAQPLAGVPRGESVALSSEDIGKRIILSRAYSGLHLNEERKKVGRNKRSVSGIDEHAGNGLRPYPGLRLRKRYVSSLK